MTVYRIGRLAAAGVFLALGCFGGSALAQGMGRVSGDISGGYDRYDVDGKTANQWNASGSAVLTIDNPGADIQVNFANSGLETPGTKTLASTSTDNWAFGGDAYWRDYAGDFGVNVTDDTFTKGTGTNYVSGGFFGEFYVTPTLTLRAKGGRFQGDLDGWYGDSGLVFYPLDQIAISLTGDYARLQNGGAKDTDVQIGIEYLPVRDVPVSLALGYTFANYQHVSGGFAGDVNIFSISLKAYFGGGGRNGGLVDYQRNGATNWDGAPASILGTTF
jgi:hypothetical protein